MDLDMDKIKEALVIIDAYINDGSMIPQDMSHPYYKAAENLEYLQKTLEPYDPDAIRRKCFEAAWEWFSGASVERTKELLEAAIMSAGKE